MGSDIMLIAGLTAFGISHRDESPSVVSAVEQVLPDAPSPVAIALQQMVAGNPVASVDAAVWSDVREFYTRREGAAAWLIDTSTAKAATALDVLSTAPDHGFASADYGEPELAQSIDTLTHSRKDAWSPQEVAELDPRITTALFALGRDVALGRATPERIVRSWKARREYAGSRRHTHSRAGRRRQDLAEFDSPSTSGVRRTAAGVK